MALDPSNDLFPFDAARLELVAGNLEVAKELAQKTLLLQPSHPHALLLLAQTLLEQVQRMRMLQQRMRMRMHCCSSRRRSSRLTPRAPPTR